MIPAHMDILVDVIEIVDVLTTISMVDADMEETV
jgi:hypothetical protein